MKHKSSKKALAIIGCITVQICVGILYVWSVFREPVIEKYGWDAGAVMGWDPSDIDWDMLEKYGY